MKNVYTVIFCLFGFFIALTANGRDDQKRNIRLIFAEIASGHSGQIESAEVKAGELYDYTPCFQYVKPLVSPVNLAIANRSPSPATTLRKHTPQPKAQMGWPPRTRMRDLTFWLQLAITAMIVMQVDLSIPWMFWMGTIFCIPAHSEIQMSA
ncbi:MAG: hypothetical protein R2769_07660 [Saprospiraceae bacterium]